MGRLSELARQHWKRLSTSGGFEEDITFKTPDGSVTLAVKGLASKHHYNVDTDGNEVNSKNAHVSVHEDLFTDASYPVRGTDGEVALIGHRVSCADSTGTIKDYVVSQCFPDETVGMLVCILSDFEDV